MINISEHLKKDFWHRRWVGDKTPPPPTNPEFYAIPERLPHVNRRDLTQDDFANEVSVSAHAINSLYQSARPIREAFPKFDENGNPVIDKDGTMMWVMAVQSGKYGKDAWTAFTKPEDYLKKHENDK